ncbi:MAG: sulfotransferase domain-containing protein [Rhodoferax sp.]|nr:sulfotransferase domain-containing protein [Rhodoferax sp.]
MKTTHFFIGPGRSGTSWLFDAMIKTRQIIVPVIKEPAFFDTHFHRGLAWYEHLYLPCAAGSKPMGRVDFSNRYYMNNAALLRIREYNPEATIIFIHRDHRELFRSMLYFEVRKGLPRRAIETMAAQKYRESHCENQIKRLRQIFGTQMIIIDFEQIRRGELKQIYTQIGLPDLTVINNNFTNALMVPRAAWMGRMAKNLALWLRRHEMFGILQRLKRMQLIRAVLFLQGKEFTEIAYVETLIKKYFPE